ncbi:hypothetical protein LWI28_018767 [Acer negundo]|uniref:Uncharacterized protein n=1 Tax=Acer negundo TaxID=4023 RepID=A0AAD5JAV8_ACENE|nr:hypothetical protein LWI28_018767 [Acer negundo]
MGFCGFTFFEVEFLLGYQLGGQILETLFQVVEGEEVGVLGDELLEVRDGGGDVERRDGSAEDLIWATMDFFESLRRERKAKMVDEDVPWFGLQDSHDHTFEIVSELGVLVQQSLGGVGVDLLDVVGGWIDVTLKEAVDAVEKQRIRDLEWWKERKESVDLLDTVGGWVDVILEEAVDMAEK